MAKGVVNRRARLHRASLGRSRQHRSPGGHPAGYVPTMALKGWTPKQSGKLLKKARAALPDYALGGGAPGGGITVPAMSNVDHLWHSGHAM